MCIQFIETFRCGRKINIEVPTSLACPACNERELSRPIRVQANTAMTLMECVLSFKDLELGPETPLLVWLEEIDTGNLSPTAAGDEVAESEVPESEASVIEIPEFEFGESLVAAAMWEEYSELVDMEVFSGLIQGRKSRIEYVAAKRGQKE